MLQQGIWEPKNTGATGMILIKNDTHGQMYVNTISKVQKENGWYEVKGKPVGEVKSGAVDFAEMTKADIEVYARGFTGEDDKPIELDRRMNKENMLKDFSKKLGA